MKWYFVLLGLGVSFNSALAEPEKAEWPLFWKQSFSLCALAMMAPKSDLAGVQDALRLTAARRLRKLLTTLESGEDSAVSSRSTIKNLAIDSKTASPRAVRRVLGNLRSNLLSLRNPQPADTQTLALSLSGRTAIHEWLQACTWYPSTYWAC